MFNISDYTKEIITSIILIIVLIVLRLFFKKIVKNYAKTHNAIENRTNLVIKYIHILLNSLTIIILFIIWGVQTKDIFITISSVATVIGVAMFAQWSILSNITSGMILFFSFPFKIGDTIKILDKDYPIEAEITDISLFHITLKSKEGEKTVYPNNLLFQKGISIINPSTETREFFD